MGVRSIKNVDEETWRNFKILAVENNLKMSVLLKMMISEFRKKSDKFWDKILNSGKNLSDDEAEVMMKVVSESRKEYGFRE